MKRCLTLLGALAVLLVVGPTDAAEHHTQLPGVAVWTIPVVHGTGFTLRLDSAQGTLEMPEGTAAAFLAGLVQGATATLPRGAWLEEVLSSGLRLKTHLTPHSTGFSLSGRRELLDRALWLASERILGLNVSREETAHLRAAVWWDALDKRYQGICQVGDEVDALRQILLGRVRGESAFSSRLHAAQLNDADFQKAALAGHREARWHLTLAGSPEAMIGMDTRLETMFKGVPPRTRTAVSRGTSAGGSPRALTRAVSARLDNARDNHRVVAVGWNLRVVQEALGWDDRALEAAVLLLATGIEHPGGRYQRHLRDDSAHLLNTAAAIVGNQQPILALRADARGSNSVRSVEVLRLSLARLEALSEEDWGGLRAHRLLELRQIGHDTEGVAEIAGGAWLGGEFGPTHGFGAWWEGLIEHVMGADRSTMRTLMGELTRSPARAELRFMPMAKRASDAGGLTESLLETYERIVTDSRCPRPGPQPAWADLIREKYGLRARTYVEMSRKLSSHPRLMRRISRGASRRCAMFQKLRKLRSYEAIAEIHHQVACLTGRLADVDKREAALHRLFKKLDLDASLYPPLVAMAREDAESRRALEAIDGECRARFGPGAAP